ncbi:MAG: hypothetical protein MRY32_09875 [Rickettsiales bacterium]|nr:hypothetical protein [Rickettsiales bacterium]
MAGKDKKKRNKGDKGLSNKQIAELIAEYCDGENGVYPEPSLKGPPWPDLRHLFDLSTESPKGKKQTPLSFYTQDQAQAEKLIKSGATVGNLITETIEGKTYYRCRIKEKLNDHLIEQGVPIHEGAHEPLILKLGMDDDVRVALAQGYVDDDSDEKSDFVIIRTDDMPLVQSELIKAGLIARKGGRDNPRHGYHVQSAYDGFGGVGIAQIPHEIALAIAHTPSNHAVPLSHYITDDDLKAEIDAGEYDLMGLADIAATSIGTVENYDVEQELIEDDGADLEEALEDTSPSNEGPKPLAEYAAQIEDAITRHRQYRQIDGTLIRQLHFDSTKRDVIEAITDPSKCQPPVSLASSGIKGNSDFYRVDDDTLRQLQPYLGSHAQAEQPPKAYEFKTSIFDRKYDHASKNYMHIRQLYMGAVQGEPENAYMYIVADQPKRAQTFVDNIEVKNDRIDPHFVTAENQRPSIIRIKISADAARDISNQELPARVSRNMLPGAKNSEFVVNGLDHQTANLEVLDRSVTEQIEPQIYAPPKDKPKDQPRGRRKERAKAAKSDNTGQGPTRGQITAARKALEDPMQRAIVQSEFLESVEDMLQSVRDRDGYAGVAFANVIKTSRKQIDTRTKKERRDGARKKFRTDVTTETTPTLYVQLFRSQYEALQEDERFRALGCVRRTNKQTGTSPFSPVTLAITLDEEMLESARARFPDAHTVIGKSHTVRGESDATIPSQIATTVVQRYFKDEAALETSSTEDEESKKQPPKPPQERALDAICDKELLWANVQVPTADDITAMQERIAHLEGLAAGLAQVHQVSSAIEAGAHEAGADAGYLKGEGEGALRAASVRAKSAARAVDDINLNLRIYRGEIRVLRDWMAKLEDGATSARHMLILRATDETEEMVDLLESEGLMTRAPVMLENAMGPERNILALFPTPKLEGLIRERVIVREQRAIELENMRRRNEHKDELTTDECDTRIRTAVEQAMQPLTQDPTEEIPAGEMLPIIKSRFDEPEEDEQLQRNKPGYDVNKETSTLVGITARARNKPVVVRERQTHEMLNRVPTRTAIGEQVALVFNISNSQDMQPIRQIHQQLDQRALHIPQRYGELVEAKDYLSERQQRLQSLIETREAFSDMAQRFQDLNFRLNQMVSGGLDDVEFHRGSVQSMMREELEEIYDQLSGPLSERLAEFDIGIGFERDRLPPSIPIEDATPAQEILNDVGRYAPLYSRLERHLRLAANEIGSQISDIGKAQVKSLERALEGQMLDVEPFTATNGVEEVPTSMILSSKNAAGEVEQHGISLEELETRVGQMRNTHGEDSLTVKLYVKREIYDGMERMKATQRDPAVRSFVRDRVDDTETHALVNGNGQNK